MDKALMPATLQEQMEKAWRACIRRAQGMPNVILAGADFIDAYRKAAQTSGTIGAASRQVTDSGKGGVSADMSTSGLYWKGIPIEYCPEWDDNFAGADTTPPSWSKRCYFLNMNHLALRPISGSYFVTRHTPRSRTNYNHYLAWMCPAGFTMNLLTALAPGMRK